MKKYVAFTLSVIYLFTLPGCSTASQDAVLGDIGISSPPSAEAHVPENPPKDLDAEKESVFSGSPDKSAADTQAVEYSYNDLYLSVHIPNDWGCKIKTAEDMAREDGLTTCAIEFWPEEYPETIFELGYMTSFGMCGTGVTIKEFALPSGLSGHRYTEESENRLWLTITLNNPDNHISGGAYCITASPELSVWDAVSPEFEKILDSVWVGPLSNTDDALSETDED